MHFFNHKFSCPLYFFKKGCCARLHRKLYAIDAVVLLEAFGSLYKLHNNLSVLDIPSRDIPLSADELRFVIDKILRFVV